MAEAGPVKQHATLQSWEESPELSSQLQTAR